MCVCLQRCALSWLAVYGVIKAAGSSHMHITTTADQNTPTRLYLGTSSYFTSGYIRTGCCCKDTLPKGIMGCVCVWAGQQEEAVRGRCEEGCTTVMSDRT